MPQSSTYHHLKAGKMKPERNHPMLFSFFSSLIFWLREPAESKIGKGGGQAAIPLKNKQGPENPKLSERANQAFRENAFLISASTH